MKVIDIEWTYFTTPHCILIDSCINQLYVMAFTSSLPFAGSDRLHLIQLKVNGVISEKYLPNLPRDDYEPHKGDLWKLDLKNYFGFSGCIKTKDIEGITIIHGSNDGWNIDSIVTFVVVDKYYWELSSADLDVKQWIDGDGSTSHEKYSLSLTL